MPLDETTHTVVGERTNDFWERSLVYPNQREEGISKWVIINLQKMEAIMAVTASRGVASGRAGGDITPVRNNADVSQREDLANFISMITRDETPFMSSIGKTKATAIYHEWQTDALEAPGNSRIVEGSDFEIPGVTTGDVFGQGTTQAANGTEFNPVGPFRSRLGNYAQINGKTISVSGTRRAIDQAGVADEYAYQLKKRGTELRRDIERDLVLTSGVSSSSGARTFGGYQAFINDAIGGTNHFHGAANGTVRLNGAAYNSGASGGTGSNVATPTSDQIGSGTVAVRPVDSSKVALSLSDVDEVMQAIYQEGGKATKIMLSPKLRRDFSDLMVTDSGVRRNIDEKGKLRQSVDVYMSDFGDLMVVPNYIMGLSYDVAGGSANEAADSAAFIYDPQWFSIATLRPLQEVDVGQRGDSTIGMLVEEQTLEVKNPIGCGAIYNLN